MLPVVLRLAPAIAGAFLFGVRYDLLGIPGESGGGAGVVYSRDNDWERTFACFLP